MHCCSEAAILQLYDRDQDTLTVTELLIQLLPLSNVSTPSSGHVTVAVAVKRGGAWRVEGHVSSMFCNTPAMTTHRVLCHGESRASFKCPDHENRSLLKQIRALLTFRRDCCVVFCNTLNMCWN